MADGRLLHDWPVRSRLVASLLGAGLAWIIAAPVASATNWAASAAPGSAAESQAQTLPSAPSPTASCKTSTGSVTIVAWVAVTHATSYSVFQSTTSGTSGFSLVTSLTTTSWTSFTLSSGNYWYKVTVTVGSHWASAQSSATLEATVVKNSSCTIV